MDQEPFSKLVETCVSQAHFKKDMQYNCLSSLPLFSFPCIEHCIMYCIIIFMFSQSTLYELTLLAQFLARKQHGPIPYQEY